MFTWIIISGLIGCIGFPLVICILGFTVQGVRRKSCASGVQSTYYRGETGGCFSCCQSLGTSIFVMVIIGFVIGAVSGGFIAHGVYENHHPSNETLTFEKFST
ncbi:Oidioi.mRNA.OKI2018_I69.PAR.g12658.t1.cds [Oikopleura dioica]|uniref:Oidioi.mRNA.OKI2018_I69.PAR.g12658.t1.cds n=1 Tax=Oikopleura dioica TaxID=34765 RepID=A0ABN7S4W6_OIKDI|nr:Oidioi.mRNA.OKI2018_I69.PAR.g12658.t1.cds [Oikopleura dioica]